MLTWNKNKEKISISQVLINDVASQQKTFFRIQFGGKIALEAKSLGKILDSFQLFESANSIATYFSCLVIKKMFLLKGP